MKCQGKNATETLRHREKLKTQEQDNDFVQQGTQENLRHRRENEWNEKQNDRSNHTCLP
jgi:hypothetical protein